MDASAQTQFSVTHARTPIGNIVRVSGTIDEKFDRSKVFGSISGVVVIDLRNVRRITSFGVREWIRGIGGLSASTCFFVNCRPNIMAQFNMVPNFGGSGMVLSFFAPFRCTNCGEESEKLIDVRTQFDTIRQGIVSAERCATCGGELEFDDVPEVFLAYFAQARLPVLPPPIAALVDKAMLDEGKPVAAAPLRAVKQIDDVVTGIWLTGSLDGRASVKRVLADIEGYVVFVLSGLDACDAQGIALLGNYTLAPGKGARFFFARVPPLAFKALQTLPPNLAGCPVISVEIPFACQKCLAPVRSEVDTADVAALATAVKQNAATGRTCVSCGGPLVAAIEPALLAQLAKARLALAPASVRGFLDLHRVSPAATPSGFSAAVTPSTQRFGQYEIIRPLGAGGMAEIYLARLSGPQGFEKTLVLKKILPGLGADPEFRRMFLSEAKLAARISHPNVVQIFELGEEQGRYFIAMEYVPGWNLNTVLATASRRGMKMPIEVACRIASDVCGGLAAAHSLVDENGRTMSVVHRDVSPHNVLISPQGNVKLTDFGIAKAVNEIEKTQPGVVKGKIAYLSPEQIDGLEVDARADIFAAGVLLYECLACRQLFRRATEAETFDAIRSGEIAPLGKFRPDVLPALEEIVMRALAREPGRRFQRAAEMQRAVEFFIASMGRPATSAELSLFLKTLMETDPGAQALRAEPDPPVEVPTQRLRH
jgi:eukaryotic-like serine/threonine-protein kinase